MAKAELIADPDYVAADISTENCHHAEGASVIRNWTAVRSESGQRVKAPAPAHHHRRSMTAQ
jgi:hypothetical protein